MDVMRGGRSQLVLMNLDVHRQVEQGCVEYNKIKILYYILFVITAVAVGAC